MSAHAARLSRLGAGRPLTATLRRQAAESWLAVAIAVAVSAICFGATGGLESMDGTGLVANVVLQMALTLGGGILLAVACVLAPPGRTRAWGLGAATAFVGLAALTAISIAWSAAPANSWLEASRTFAYTATFLGALALARIAASRWRSVLIGVALATVVVSGYALAAKIAPEALDASDPYARLQLPFSYWNAVGLTAALGIPPCLWLGARRGGHGLVGALAAPALCLLLITVMLSYSRGAIAAVLIGVAFWFATVPLRLRALATLAVGGLAAAVVAAWAFRQPALTSDHVALAARSSFGHRLGIVLGAALVAAFLAAVVARFLADRHPLSAARRRRLGIAVLVAVALVPLAGAGALTRSSRGLVGTITHAVHTLTTATATQTSGPGRLIAAGNDHALYWSYALDVFNQVPFKGAGAGAYPIADQQFMTGPALAEQAHSYVFQTLADLGLLGLAVSLGLAVAWGIAAVRTTGLGRIRGPAAEGAERVGMLTMASVVLIFAVHSTVDWTWFVPGDAIVALLCAGWIAGRGPLAAAAPARLHHRLARRPVAIAAAAAAVAIALLAAWAEWQPLRSQQAASAGEVALGNGLAAGSGAAASHQLAIAQAELLSAVSRDPLDITPLAFLADTYAAMGRDRLALATFRREVALQPSNAQSWHDLAQYEWNIGNKTASYNDFSVALSLNPQDPVLRADFLATR